MPDLLSTIRARMDELRKSEKKVAEYILQNPEYVIQSTITDLAEEAGTSEPTVIRFCRKLGMKGFMDFKLSMARDLPASHYIHEDISKGDTLPKIFTKLLNAAKNALSETVKAIDLGILEEAVAALASARRIEFYGMAGSGTVAKDAYHKFFRLGIPCAVYDDPHMQVMSAALLSPEDVVVAISYTGSTKDVVDSVTIAKASGARVIGITGKRKSPLSKLCDIPISVHSHEAALRLAPMTSRLVQLAVLDVLFVAVAMENFDEVNQKLELVKRSLVDKRY
jgi:RpiR family carbohydrate utilization transcriptional regulator